MEQDFESDITEQKGHERVNFFCPMVITSFRI